MHAVGGTRLKDCIQDSGHVWFQVLWKEGKVIEIRPMQGAVKVYPYFLQLKQYQASRCSMNVNGWWQVGQTLEGGAGIVLGPSRYCVTSFFRLFELYWEKIAFIVIMDIPVAIKIKLVKTAISEPENCWARNPVRNTATPIIHPMHASVSLCINSVISSLSTVQLVWKQISYALWIWN